MKSLMIYIGGFLAICSVTFYQSCTQSDHINCYTFKDIEITAMDLTTSTGEVLHEGDSVYAKKFGFTYSNVLTDTVCKKPSINLINSAYAYKIYNDNTFIKDSIKSIEIYSVQDFNTQYPAGSVLNNLFEIPPIESGGAYSYYSSNMNSSFQVTNYIKLVTIPDQTKDFKFYVKTTTKENRVFIDSLPTIKIKI